MPPSSRRPAAAGPAPRRPLGLAGLDLGPAIGSTEATAAKPAQRSIGGPRIRRPAALSLSDWRTYRRRLADLPADEPGRDRVLAEADRMIQLLALLDDSPAG